MAYVIKNNPSVAPNSCMFQAVLPQGRGHQGIERGILVLIAVLVQRVTLAKRLDVKRLIMDRIPALRNSIGREVAEFDRKH